MSNFDKWPDARSEVDTAVTETTTALDLAKFAMYRMQENHLLGENSIAVVYSATPEEVRYNGLTSETICTYIKTPHDNSAVTSLEALASTRVFNPQTSTLLRVASSCEFGIFGDSHCDCESQRVAALHAIRDHGQGAFMQLPQEGLGFGLLYKARELELQVNGTMPNGTDVGKKDFFQAAHLLLGEEVSDPRRFALVGSILGRLGLAQYAYTLLSSNPAKTEELSRETGLTIADTIDIPGEITIENIAVYLAKVCEGIPISSDVLIEIRDILKVAEQVPDRALALIQRLKGMLSEDTLTLQKNRNILESIVRLLD